jgi:hypothetical protein
VRFAFGAGRSVRVPLIPCFALTAIDAQMLPQVSSADART